MTRRTIARVAVVLLLLTSGVGVASAAPVRSGSLTWQPAQLTDPPAGFTSVSCVTRKVCRAGDHGNRIERWDGRHWTPGTTLTKDFGYYTDLDSIECPSSTFCAAVQHGDGEGYRPVTRNPDGTWNVSAAVASDRWVGTISCIDRTFCMLTTSGTYQLWNGRAWTRPAKIAATRTFSHDTVQCLTRTLCRVVNEDGDYFVWNGSRWTVQAHLGHGGELSCPTTTFCMLVGEHDWRRFNGTRWSSAHRLAGAERLAYQKALSCVRPAYCVTVRDDGVAYTWNGSIWRGPVSLGVVTAQDVSCASKDFCVVTTENGAAVHRVDGVWQAPRRDADQTTGGYTQVSCDSAQLCVLVDAQGGASAFEGSGWSAPRFVPDHGLFYDISCGGESLCLTTGRNGVGQFRRHGDWSPRFFSGNLQVSCGSSSLCITTSYYEDEESGGYTTSATVWDRSGHHTLNTYAEYGTITPACAADGCVLSFGYPFHAEQNTTVVYRPGQDLETIAGNGSVGALSCTSVSFCLGVTDDNTPMRFDGTSWTSLPGRIPKMSLSCASEDLCVSVGSHSEATWDGTAWGAAQQIVGPAGYVYDVSCKTGICAATGYGWTVIAR